MNLAIKIMIFSMMLNFAVGAMTEAIPAFQKDPTRMGSMMNYSINYTDSFIGGMDTKVEPGGDMEDKADWFDRVLDVMHLGWINKIRPLISTYLYGFINMLQNIFARGMDGTTPGLSGMLFGAMKLCLMVAYIFTIFWLFTGKKMNYEGN